MRILLIEEDKILAGLLLAELEQAGIIVKYVHSAQKGAKIVIERRYDLVICGIPATDGTGTSGLRRLRKVERNVPIIVLAPKDDLTIKLENFAAGADDYLVKPFAIAELVARIRAITRRTSNGSGSVITLADLEVDRISRNVRRDRHNIALSPKEYYLLEYLLLNHGQVLTRQMILERIWDPDFDGPHNIVDVYIRQLRIKLDQGFRKKLIHTVRGTGYKIGLQ